MSGNAIFRGPITHQPITVNKPVAGAYLPGTFVEETATTLTQLTTAVDKLPLILANVDFKDQDAVTAYASGDTGIGIQLTRGMVVQASLAAATYAKGDPLTIVAAGQLGAATLGTKVIAFFDDTPGAFGAGALGDVIIADGYIKA